MPSVTGGTLGGGENVLLRCKEDISVSAERSD